MTLNVQNVHRWLTHIAYMYLQSHMVVFHSCQWLSPVTQTKLTKMHFQTRELVLASVAAVVTTPAFPPNLIIQWIEVG